MPNRKHQNLSILLMKDKFDNLDQYIKPGIAVKEYEIQNDNTKVGKFYIKPSAPHPPKWATFFENVLDIHDIGYISSVSAVLLINTDDKVFAISFGQGRHILKQDCWVERFGLKVALNSIGREKIRTIDKQTFDAISRQSKEQASKETRRLVILGSMLNRIYCGQLPGYQKIKELGSVFMEWIP